MATQQFKNNANTTLSGSINNSQTAVTVINASNFPVISGGDYFYATMYELSGSVEINIEIVKVTATSGTSWTIVRGQDGTTARSRDGLSTCYIELRLTAAGAQEMLQRSNNLSDLQSASTARANLGLASMATQDAASVAITGGTISGVAITGIDSQTTIQDDLDSTKKFNFQLSGIDTGTTRTLTVPNASGTLAFTSDLSSYQPLDSDLTAIAALAANGIIARTGTGTVSVRSITQPAAGLTVTNGDGVSGNPTLGLANDLAAVESMTTTGFVRRTGTDTWTAAAITDGELPSALTGKSYNALTLAANATGFTVSGGTVSKTLNINNSITLAGTDGTTITLPSSSGTVALNNQTLFLGTTSVAINRASAALSLAGVSIDGSAASATTATTATNLASGAVNQIPYQTASGTSSFITAPSVASTYLQWNGTAFVWAGVSAGGGGTVTSVDVSSSDLTVTGSPVTSSGTISLALNTVAVAKGGTGQTTASAGFNALSPITTLGDIIYGSAANTSTRLAGNTSTTRRLLRQVGDGTNSSAPAWDTLIDGDIPSALTGKTYNALTLTAAATGFTVAGGTTSKTLTVSNTLTLAGTDASTLNIGAGGTLGSAAFTASSAYAPSAGSSSIATVGTITSGTWTGSQIGISYGGTGATTKAGGFNALSPVTTLGDLIYGDGANSNNRLAGNTTTTKKFLRQTGDGTLSAAPAWDTLVDGDLPSALTGKTYNALSLTAAATGFTVAGGTTSKTLTVSNTLTLAGTDSSTLNIGSGGTLGSAAFTASTAYAPAAGSSSITTVGTVTSGTWNGTAIGISYGGTGATTKTAGYNALTPMTTLGDLVYHDGTNGVRLAGSTASGKRFLRQTGTGVVSAAPAWDTLVDGDIPSALTGKTYNALTLTAAATGFTVAGGTTSKTLTVNNTLTLSGTDASTLNIGAGGTLGSAAFTASTAYAPSAGSSSVVTLGTVTTGTWSATAIAADKGGTGQTSYTIGDLLYASTTSALSKLAGVATGNALISGGVGAAFSWGKIGLSTHVSGTLAIGSGGTGQTTATAAFTALSPMTTLGDTIYHDGTNPVRLAPNTTTTKKFLRQTGTGTVGAAPAWDTLVDGDLPLALTGKTYNGLTLTANATGFSAAGGTTSKTLTVNNSITLAGTDGTTITLPATTGTVALNNQTQYIGTTAVAINRASASLSLTGVSIDGSAGSASSATKATNLAGGNGTTLLGSVPYQSGADTTTLLSPNVSATKQFLSQTGTGTNGAAPAWSSVSKSDVGLSSVENTALSTWAGSTNITTLGTVTSGTWSATAIAVTKGGTGQTTSSAGFNALSPVTTLGDLIYGDGANSNARLAGNVTSTKKFLRQTGTGTISAAPAWDTLVDGDIPTALTGKTYNALTLTAAATGFTIAGGSTSKTLTVSNTLTLSGTDSSTLNIGAGGTLGTGAFATIANYAALGSSNTFNAAQTIAGNLLVGASTAAGRLTVTSGFNQIYGSFDSSDGYANFALLSGGLAYGYLGQASAVGTGNNSDFSVRAQGQLNFLTGGNNTRVSISSTGLTTLFGDLAMSGTSRRITGDFSNATLASRTLFQTSTATSSSSVGVIPSSGGSGSRFISYGAADPDNSHTLELVTASVVNAIISNKTGTGSYKSLGIQVGGAYRMTFGATGGVTTSTSLYEGRVAMPANDIDLFNGNYYSKTISGATTLTVSNVPSSGTAVSFILDLTNGGSAAITWWSGVKWAGGTAPTLTAAGRDVLGFFTYDAGTTWTGLVLGKDVK